MEIITHISNFGAALVIGVLLGGIYKQLTYIYTLQKQLLQREILRDYKEAYADAIRRGKVIESERILFEIKKIEALYSSIDYKS